MNRHAAIHWKTNNAPGVVVVDGQIRDWPDALGLQPDEATILGWIAEYEIHDAAQKVIKAEQDEIESLINQKLRDNAIAELKKEGKLGANGKIPK